MNDVLTLLWKEYRTNAHLIIVGLTVLFLPMLLAVSMAYANSNGGSPWEIIGAGLTFGTVASMVFSQGMMICLGGLLIGGERSARTFEFLFNQPVSKTKIVISKLLFALAWTVVVWLIGITILNAGLQLVDPGRGVNLEALGIAFFVDVGVVGLMLFSACWMASSMIEGSVLAMAIGAMATALLYLLVKGVSGQFDWVVNLGDYDGTRIMAFSVFSIISIAVGANRFLGRKSP